VERSFARSVATVWRHVSPPIRNWLFSLYLFVINWQKKKRKRPFQSNKKKPNLSKTRRDTLGNVKHNGKERGKEEKKEEKTWRDNETS
jgi:hypothetical protein